jgi:hypothetical protein
MTEEKPLAELQVTAEMQAAAEEQPIEQQARPEEQPAPEVQVVPEEQFVAAETTTAAEQPMTMTAETTTAEEKPMAEETAKLAPENRVSFFQLCSELNAPWWSGIQRLAAWYIDLSEQLARRGLDIQEQATGWAKDTPWAPLFQSQHTLMSQWIDGSVTLARNLWRLEQAEEAAKKAEGGAERQ